MLRRSIVGVLAVRRAGKLLLAAGVASVLLAGSASAADVIYSTTDNGASIATIDPSSGAASVLGPTGFSNGFAAALDTDGTLWTTVNGFGAAQIAAVDKTTGQATLAPSPIGTAMISLEIAADGAMYGLGYNDRRLYRIDKSTGVGTPVGPDTGINTPMDIAFDCDGQLWATANGNLWTVDTTTGIATAKPSITGVAEGAAMVMGLTFDSSRRMLGTTYTNPGTLYAIDETAGTATSIGSTGLDMPHGGSVKVMVPDTQAPTTTDDVPAGFRNAAVTVTLRASDDGGSGVAHSYYTVGASPAAPTTSSSVYDPAHKPTLDEGQRIRYFSVDARGNAETSHSSAAAKVDTQAPTTTDNVPAGVQRAPVAVTLTAADNPAAPGPSAGVAQIYYAIGADPAAPTTESRHYDPAAKPVLADGQKIRYFAVDQAGNAEAGRTSRAAQVVNTSRRRAVLHLRKRYRGHAVRAVRATTDRRTKTKVTRTRRGHTLVIDMRGHPCTPVKVRIRVLLEGAPTRNIRKTYRTCQPGER